MKNKLKLLFLRLTSIFPRFLPVGIAEYNAWAARIRTQVNLPNVPEDHIKFALSSQIMHLGATQALKPDLYFVLALRKVAANQVAGQVFQDVKIKQQEEAAKQQAEATAKQVASDDPQTQN